MNSNSYKKYTVQAKRRIKGESLFESIISEFAIPHHIVGQKDIGIDYFCEWVFGDKPTGVLFAVQIKTFYYKTAIPKFIGKSSQNQLQEYSIKNSNLKPDIETLHYWQGLGIPIFLFAVFEDDGGNLHLFYKRYTSFLARNTISFCDNEYSEKYYEVTKNNTFIAFANMDEKTNGFARDLFIDHIRWNYFKGSILYLNPRSIGLNQFPEDNIFPELAEEYQDKINLTYSKWKKYLEKINIVIPCEDNINFATAATASDIDAKITKL
jgi:hypothetical protein